MARLNSWLSPDVMHALGWALIHSLWQCLGLAALAAALIALSSRPSVRYVVAVGALAAMLAAPVATLFVWMRPAALIQVAPATVPPSAQSVVSPPPAASLPAASGPALSSTRSEGVKAVPVVHPLEDFRSRLASQDILPWLVAAWLCGVAFFSLRFAGGFLLLEYKRRRQSTAPNTGILALCQDVQRQLGLDRAIRYLECSWLQAPAVIGWLRPIVLIPISALTGLTPAQLRAVIAHELAHIRRFDAFVNIFQILVETLLFYHPAVWWLNRRIRAERELACDEIAVAASGSRLEYAQALTLMAEWERAPRLAMAANRGPLSERIFHILGRKSSSAGQRLLGLTGSILFLIAALAAANALIEIAAPPIAHAKASVEAALSTARITVDRLARHPLGAVTKPSRAEPASQAGSANPQSTPGQTEDAKVPEKLVPPSSDLTGLLPTERLAIPTVVASQAAPAATPAEGGSKEMPPRYVCYNTSVYGRVISSEAIQMPGFGCALTSAGPESRAFPTYGPCPYASANYPFAKQGEGPSGKTSPCTLDVTMNVQLADPSDAAKMKIGKIVRVAGEFQIQTRNGNPYLYVKNARIIWTDPFDRDAAADRSPNAQPSPTVRSASLADPAATGLPAASMLLPVDPEGVPARTGSNEPRPIRLCTRNNNVTGRVISPHAIHLRLGFDCMLYDEPGAVRFGYGVCPCKGVIMNVEPADAAEAGKLVPGKRVTVFGKFQYAAIDHVNYLIVKDARLNVDPFDPPVPPDYRALINALITKNASMNANASGQGEEARAPKASSDATTGNQTVASTAKPVAQNEPRPRTQAALVCLLGFPPAGCEDVFEESVRSEALRQTTNCAKEYVTDYREGEIGERLFRKGVCKDGPLDKVDYLGANAAGSDVYEVQYRNTDTVYVIAPPGPSGKIAEFRIMRGSPSQIIPSSLVQVTPGTPSRSIYRRAATNGTAAPIQPITRDQSAGPAQAALSAPPATLPKLDTNEPYESRTCDRLDGGSSSVGTDGTFMGRVTSSTTVQVPYFAACRKVYGWSAEWGNFVGGGGPCENHTHTIRSPIWGRYCPITPWLTITVQFANPADASKMPLGKVVRLKGEPFIITQNKVDYLGVKDARVLYADPFDRSSGAENTLEAPTAPPAGAISSDQSKARMEPPEQFAAISGNPVVVPDTPSGEGDPNTIVCRAPQRFAGSDRSGPRSCGYNYEWAQLMAQGKDLAPDGKTVVDKPTVANPTGEGNPVAVTCRAPQDLEGPGMRIRHPGPKFCQTNRFWADLIRNHKQLTADGKIAPESFRVPQSNLNSP